MQTPYVPRGLHEELEARFDRLVTRRHRRRTGRADGTGPGGLGRPAL